MQPTSSPPTQFSRQLLARRPQTVAWSILTASFALFCIGCVVSTFGVYWFLFESRIALTASLTITRGSVTAIYVDGQTNTLTGTLPLDNVGALQTGEVSQGYLTFTDNYSRQTIATVFLLPNSRLSLGTATRPRFEWSRNNYLIGLNIGGAHIQVDLPTAVARPVIAEIQSAVGDAVLLRSGEYRVDLVESRFEVYVESGLALLRNQRDQTWQIPEQQYGVIARDQQIASVQPFPYLVLNTGFGSPDDVPTKPGLPVGWYCSYDVLKGNEIIGTSQRALADEQQLVLHVFRRGVGLNHAENGCEFQFFAPQEDAVCRQSINVQQYTSLRIRARFRINEQDLSTCGILGTECPVMLQLKYKAAQTTAAGSIIVDDQQRPLLREQDSFWRQGFYTVRPEGDTQPLGCNTCPQLHEKIAPDAWYIFDSGDLFQVLGGSRPICLDHVKVYASGHAYDMMIGSLEIIGGTIPTASP